MNTKSKIAVIGLWHLGEIFSAGLADLGHEVIGISDDKKVVADFLKNIPPLAEPQLADLIKKNRAEHRLFYVNNFSAVKDCDVVWLTLDTKVDVKDRPDLKEFFQSLDKIIPHLKNNSLVVVSSQIPVGTSSEIINRIKKQQPKINFDYVYTPENLRLGEAVKCFFEPVRIIVGSNSESALQKIQTIFSPLKVEIISMSPASAELGKHALNAFLATSISFANDLADVAENVGANMMDVSRVLRSDPRIGQKAYLDAGLSFSGWTLKRDLLVLSSLIKKFKIKPTLIEATINKNEARKKMVVTRLKKELKNLRGQKIVIWGLTYKPGTSTLRRSHALEVASDLVKSGASVSLHDPQAIEGEIDVKKTIFNRDIYSASTGAQIIILMTAWPDYQNIDLAKLSKVTALGATLFDPSNFLYHQREKIKKAGFKYLGVGISYDA